MSVRVVVVEDDFRVASVHASVVASVEGCSVVGTATTIQQARELIAAGADLVLADECLPDGSGLDLIGAGDAAVLLVTAADEAEIVRRALLRGAIGYLVKPFPLPSLSDRLADFVRFHQALGRASTPRQADIDTLIRLLRPRTDQQKQPKGRSAVTAASVADLLRGAEEPLTAVAVAAEIGVSRATAQRYLSDLVDHGDAVLALRYGTAGRPEHSYRWAR